MIFLIGDRVRIRIRKKHKEYTQLSKRRWNGKTGTVVKWKALTTGGYVYIVRLGPTNYQEFHPRVLNFLESKEEVKIRQDARKQEIADLGIDI